MTEFEHERDEDFTDEAAEATEEARRRAAEEGRTIEDQPESGRVADDENSDDEPTAY
ncbi:MAG TPA: hypothetical protein VHF67_00775 [Gaiellaceae bacterium]|nr:hypothetical protein [Gaiellaceae bacterium]